MEQVDLSQGELNDHVALAVKAIRDGYIICVPLEHAYVFLTDAFSHFAVRTMHVLRGDKVGVVAQVLVENLETVEGLARQVSPEARALMTEFWPGPLSMNLRPNHGLNWDLGDDRSLDQMSVRVPASTFVLEILKQTGPLAVASAARAQQKALRTLVGLLVLESDLAAKFDAGELPEGTPSTVVECDESGLRLVRMGSISFDEMLAVAPSLSAQ